MNAATIRIMIAAWTAAMASPVWAEATPEGCPAAPVLQNIAARERTLASFERMPVPCLKVEYLRCARAANEHLLGMAEATSCSMTHEALLKRGFQGDFNALLAWWRGNRP